MSGETESNVSGWTVDTLRLLHRAEREGDLRVEQERDRRYTEVNIEREKALKIKETADLAALDLAREIQTYKDEKANDLRTQIERERGTYATRLDLANIQDKFELLIKPLTESITLNNGGRIRNAQLLYIVSILAAVATALVIGLSGHFK